MNKKQKIVDDLKQQQPQLNQDEAVMITNFLLVLAEVHFSNSQKSNPKTK